MNIIRQRIESLTPQKRQLLAQMIADVNRRAPTDMLQRHDGREAGAVATKKLTAYVTSTDRTQQASAEDLLEWLGERYPAFMLPDTITFRASLPRTPNGKVDTNALPELANEPAEDRRFVPPSNDRERRLAELWSDVLGLERIGIDDGFYEVGGDSLVSIRLISRIREEFGYELSFQQFSDEPTIAGIAKQLELADRIARRPLPTKDAVRQDDEEREEFTI